MSLFSRLTTPLLSLNPVRNEINRRVSLAVKALDDSNDRLLRRDTYPRDRHDRDRSEVLRDALDAWRTNPLARRIVELTSQYVVGGGIGIEAKAERTHRFLQSWWNHRLNRMPTRAFDLCDELTRTGNLFIVISTDPAGMSYIRAIPSADILEIETAPNDVEQEFTIWEKAPEILTPSPSSPLPSALTSVAGPDGISGIPWPVYDERIDGPDENGAFKPVILHYSVNRPVGAKWGESDLAPLLRWLARYSAWLEDRARLNRYRQSFVYVVKAAFTNQAERLQRQAELNANPPNPGSILVSDSSEEWSVLNPTLASFEAAEDGLALKKMIAVGAGSPLHFLAEPESSTRTTAESAGGPTFRHYEQRQQFFLWLIKDLAQVVVTRRSTVDSKVNPKTEISVRGSDISARDNAALATAANLVINAFSQLRLRNLIDDAELLRLAYRFAGEVTDVEDMLRRGAAAPAIAAAEQSKPSASGGSAPHNSQVAPGIKVNPIKISPATGEPTNLE